LTSSQENPIGLRRFGYEETLPARHVCAREVVESTAGQYSVMILVARILLVQKADAAGFVWTLTGIKFANSMGRCFSRVKSLFYKTVSRSANVKNRKAGYVNMTANNK